MKQELFDSFDVLDVHDDLWENWDEECYGERPERDDDPLVWEIANDIIQDDYSIIRDSFISKAKDTDILLIGYLGLWNGRPFAYKVTDVNHALDWLYDEMDIWYEDGDLWMGHHHHDGTNVFRVLGLKHISDFKNDPTVSEEEYEDLDEWLYMLQDGVPLQDTEETRAFIDKVTFSTAPYLKDWLSYEAQEDLKKHEEEAVGV